MHFAGRFFLASPNMLHEPIKNLQSLSWESKCETAAKQDRLKNKQTKNMLHKEVIDVFLYIIFMILLIHY